MKYLFKTFLFLLIILLLLKFTIHLLDSGHETTYINGNFNISENYQAKDNNYMFTIKNDKFKLKFDITADYNKAQNIITKIYYKNIDEYECVLPIFKENKVFTDIMCKKDNTVYYARDIDNNNIKTFAHLMKKYGYNMDNYQDKAKKTELSATQSIYNDNILENHYLALENYKGLDLYNSDSAYIKLFENDIYKKTISIFTDKYYVVADYNNEYTFKIFKVVNIINGTEKEIRSYDEISFDTIVQGVVDGRIYIFDKESKNQYKIDLKNETVEKVNNDKIKYYNGKWSTMTLSEALNGKTFDSYYVKIPNVDKADKVGRYYYLYEKEEDHYLVYKTYDKKITQKTFLFETSDINSVIYLDNYIYFRNGNAFYYYSDNGVRKVLENDELNFNNDITLGVYIK